MTVMLMIKSRCWLPGRCGSRLLAAGAALPADQALPLYIRDQVAQTTLQRAAQKAAL